MALPEYDPAKFEYEFRRSVIAEIAKSLLEKKPKTRQETLKILGLKNPYDFGESIWLENYGQRTCRPVKILDKVAEIFTGDRADWSELTGLRFLDIAGGHGDIFSEFGVNSIRPIYPFMSVLLTAMGANVTNIDLGPKPVELPDSFHHRQMDLIKPLMGNHPFIPGIKERSLDLITCLRFCDIDNPDPSLHRTLGSGRNIEKLYEGIKLFASKVLVPGGLLIIDGKKIGEIWMPTDSGLHKLEENDLNIF